MAAVTHCSKRDVQLWKGTRAETCCALEDRVGCLPRWAYPSRRGCSMQRLAGTSGLRHHLGSKAFHHNWLAALTNGRLPRRLLLALQIPLQANLSHAQPSCLDPPFRLPPTLSKARHPVFEARSVQQPTLAPSSSVPCTPQPVQDRRHPGHSLQPHVTYQPLYSCHPAPGAR